MRVGWKEYIKTDKGRAAVKRAQDNRRKRLTSQYRAEKARAGCQDCERRLLDVVRRPELLEFYHLTGAEKTMPVERMVFLKYSWERIVAEMNKCTLLCQGCFSHIQKDYPEYLQEVAGKRKFRNVTVARYVPPTGGLPQFSKVIYEEPVVTYEVLNKPEPTNNPIPANRKISERELKQREMTSKVLDEMRRATR
jgi:hypothetical protein